MYGGQWICPACGHVFKLRLSNLRLQGARQWGGLPRTGPALQRHLAALHDFLETHPGANWKTIGPYVAGKDAAARIALKHALRAGTVVRESPMGGAWRYYLAEQAPADAEIIPAGEALQNAARCPACRYQMSVTIDVEVAHGPLSKVTPREMTGCAHDLPIERAVRIAEQIKDYYRQAAAGGGEMKRTITELKGYCRVRRCDVRGALRLLERERLIEARPGGPHGSIWWVWIGEFGPTAQVRQVRANDVLDDDAQGMGE